MSVTSFARSVIAVASGAIAGEEFAVSAQADGCHAAVIRGQPDVFGAACAFGACVE